MRSQSLMHASWCDSCHATARKLTNHYMCRVNSPTIHESVSVYICLVQVAPVQITELFVLSDRDSDNSMLDPRLDSDKYKCKFSFSKLKFFLSCLIVICLIHRRSWLFMYRWLNYANGSYHQCFIFLSIVYVPIVTRRWSTEDESAESEHGYSWNVCTQATCY